VTVDVGPMALSKEPLAGVAPPAGGPVRDTARHDVGCSCADSHDPISYPASATARS